MNDLTEMEEMQLKAHEQKIKAAQNDDDEV